MLRSRPLHLASLAALLAAACAHVPPSTPEPPVPVQTTVPTPLTDAERASLGGIWVYSGGAAEQTQVDEAVARATADMGFLARGFAAQALGDRARPRDRYTLKFEGSTVSIASPDNPIERGEVGGPAVPLTNRFGDTSQTTFQLRDGALVQAGKSADGSGETVFTPSGDGRTLRVRRVMRSGQLSAPVDVTLSYRRQE